jgi:hypothetical protein
MGGANLARRRGAKAHRRKVIMAQKRKAGAGEATPAGQAALGASLPIQYCLLTENLFEIGMGTLILARGRTFGSVVVGAFLLDSFCRGVKDTFVRTLDGDQLEFYLERIYSAMPAEPVDPAYARKLLRDLTRWSGSLGFPPPRSLKHAERLFGEVDWKACTAEFTFGQNGKPLYVSGPDEPASTGRKHVQQLREKLGPDGIDYILAPPVSSGSLIE